MNFQDLPQQPEVTKLRLQMSTLLTHLLAPAHTAKDQLYLATAMLLRVGVIMLGRQVKLSEQQIKLADS